jgi:hypothetical protein
MPHWNPPFAAGPLSNAPLGSNVATPQRARGVTLTSQLETMRTGWSPQTALSKFLIQILLVACQEREPSLGVD